WQLLLIVMGMWTAVATAYFALQQTDLKKLIAYSTVSQLGWIVATIGVGTKFAIMAAVVHTIAHAMFKSSLFMMAGVVDHQAGTRDIRR
ncbi:proton-conducting transporter membrane subunit, partial [Enterococcus faecalis]|uniref:proton-conducting transporter transmembrane domain-containing protein n=2 Tax=Bacillati TaxID=1783272 RepID=UPI00254ED535